MSFNIVGVGPGDSELLTVKAVRLIKEADLILAPVKKQGSRESTALKIARPYIEDLSKVEYCWFPMVKNFRECEKTRTLFHEHGEVINGYLKKGLRVVFLTLGDPSVYSTFTHIAPHFKEVSFTPGIASFLNGAALGGLPLCIADESLCIINMTDREENIRKAFDLHKNIVVMKVSANQPLLKSLLKESHRECLFLSNIGLEEESSSRNPDILDEKMPYFTIGIIKEAV